jgi:hypothetical protein
MNSNIDQKVAHGPVLLTTGYPDRERQWKCVRDSSGQKELQIAVAEDRTRFVGMGAAVRSVINFL